MTDVLVPNLNFGSNGTFPAALLPQAGQLLLITDHLAAPAEFILHRALHLCLKAAVTPLPTDVTQRGGAMTILVSFSRTLSHWRAVASKAGVNLTQHLKTGSLAFVDGLGISAYANRDKDVDDDEVGCTKCPSLFLAQEDGVKSEEPSLNSLYDVIKKVLPPTAEREPSASQVVVIIDDITLLSFIGISETALTRFIRALRALCHRRSAGLIIRAHASSSPATQDTETAMPFASSILRALIESSHRHIEVRPLASGRSGAITGEIAVHSGGLGITDDAGGEKMGRKAAVHYRLNDSGVTFFHKGMGAGVL